MNKNVITDEVFWMERIF